MATLYLQAKVNATDYGSVGSGFVTNAFLRLVSFGAYDSSDEAHFDIRNIKVGTTGYGSSDLFAPVLNDLTEFDGVYGNDGSIAAASGVLSVDAASGDHYGYKDFGADITDLYVQFDLRVRAGGSPNCDCCNVWDDATDPPFDGGAVDGLFFYSGGTQWVWDGPGDNFGSGPSGAPVWDTINLHFSFASPSIVADFSGSPVSGTAPLVVAFTDLSTPGPSGPITAWAWDFGDGATSTLQNPTHTYVAAGTYTVSLTVTGTTPDGTDTKTRTGYVDVGTSPPNTAQGTATALAPGCSGTTVSNRFAPDTPAVDDPLNTVYGLGGVFSRQVWFKLTNTSPDQAYARFTLTAPMGVAFDIAAAIYLDDPATDPLTIDRTDGSDSVFLWDRPLGGGASDTLGVALLPGQTVWLEIAGDDARAIGWDGNLTLDWELLDATFYDAADNYAATDFLPATGGTQFRGGLQAPESGSLDTLSYAKVGNKHFWAVRDGPYDSSISVWVWTDGGGAPTIYHVVLPYAGHALTRRASGPGFGYGNSRPLLRTDGTNLWLVSYYEDFGAAACSGATYTAHGVSVFTWTGSGFSVLGLDSGPYFKNTDSAGRWDQLVGQFAATADPSDPGHLHVVYSEAGPTDCLLNADGNPRHMGARVSYSKWSTSGMILQNDALSYGAGTPVGTFPRIPSTPLTGYLGITNAYGNVVMFHGPCVDYDPTTGGGAGSITYDSVVNMYSIDGAGAATLEQTFDVSVGHTGTRLNSAFAEVTLGLTQRSPQLPLAGQDQILVWVATSTGSRFLAVPADGSGPFADLGLSRVGNFMEAICDGRNVWFGAGHAGSSGLGINLGNASLTCANAAGRNVQHPPLVGATGLGAGVPEFIWDDVADCLYTMGWNGLNTPNQEYAPIKIPILRDYLICTIGTCVIAGGLHIWQRF